MPAAILSLGNLQIKSAGNVQTKAIKAASITQTGVATGAVTISGDLKATNGDISFINPVALNNVPTNNVSFTAETGRITLSDGFVAGSKSLTLTADQQIDIFGISSGTGDLVLQPSRPDLNIALGDISDRPDSLDLTGLNNLADGFKSIAIGGTDSSGAITIESPLTFKDPVTIRSPQGLGSIAILPDGTLTGVDNASIALTANQNITAGNINTSGSGDITLTSNIGTIALNGPITTIDQNITFNGPVTLQNNVLVDTGAVGAGNILFSSTLNGTTANNQNLTLTAGTGNILFKGDVGNPIAIGNLQINSASDLETAAITANSITQTGTGTTAFKGAVTTNGAGGINLTGTNLAIDNPVTTQNNGSFKVNNSGDLNIATGANLVLDGEFTQSGTGRVNIASNITTTNDNISFNSPVTITTNDISFNTGAGAGDIIFNNTVEGTTANSPNLTLTAGTGNIEFTTGAIGNSTTPFGAITANSSGTTSFANTVNAQSLTTDSGGTTKLNGNVTTTGPQTYSDAVTIANNPILSGSDINFNNTVDGSSDLTVNANSGNVTFNGAVGAESAIGNLTANSTGTTAFNQTVNAASLTTDAGGTTKLNGNVTTTGPQTYSDAVTIANNPILSGSDLTFNNTVDGSSDLTVNANSGNVTFNGAIGATTPLTNLTANSKISLGGNVTTTGSQTYADAVTVAKNSVLSGSGITFNKTVDVPGNLGIAADNVNLKGTVTTTNDGTLTITNKVNLNIENNLNLDGAFIQKGGGTVAVSGNITTTNDNISFSDPVTLKGPVSFTLGEATIAFGSSLAAGSNPLTLTAGEIDFSGQVSGTGALRLQPATAGQNIAVGPSDNNTSALDLTASELNLIQNGFSSIDLGRSDSSANVSIPSNLTFLDPVNIQGGTGTIAVDGTLTGNDNSSIALNAARIDLNNGINTNKNQLTINGNVQLGNDINLRTAGGDIKIIGAIDGNHLLNLDAATGNVLVQGNIGGTAPLSVLNVTATQAQFTGNIASNSGLNIAAANTLLGGNVTTNQGNININGVLGLTKDVILTTAGGNIAFGGAIDSIDAARSLNLDAGSRQHHFQRFGGGHQPVSKSGDRKCWQCDRKLDN
jgi:hypothetical protein